MPVIVNCEIDADRGSDRQQSEDQRADPTTLRCNRKRRRRCLWRRRRNRIRHGKDATCGCLSRSSGSRRTAHRSSRRPAAHRR